MSDNPETDDFDGFFEGMCAVFQHVQNEITTLTHWLSGDKHKDKYIEMNPTAPGMLAGWRICETALANAMREQETPDDQS